jgi:hypothetical protein
MLKHFFFVMSCTLDDCENASTSGEEEEHDSDMEKLTRAQRKRIRKKKMKEEAIVRGKLIGPLMPLIQTTQREDDDPPPVRSNASEEGYSIVNLLTMFYECLVYVHVKVY